MESIRQGASEEISQGLDDLPPEEAAVLMLLAHRLERVAKAA